MRKGDIMVRILLNKQDVMNVLAWAGKAQVDAVEMGIPFEVDELKTLKKFKEVIYETKKVLS